MATDPNTSEAGQGYCHGCARPHDPNIPCDAVTEPCFACGKPLLLLERWQLTDGRKPLCAGCYTRLKTNP